MQNNAISVEGILQDIYNFLHKILATEKLSKAAEEYRHRLVNEILTFNNSRGNLPTENPGNASASQESEEEIYETLRDNAVIEEEIYHDPTFNQDCTVTDTQQSYCEDIIYDDAAGKQSAKLPESSLGRTEDVIYDDAHSNNLNSLIYDDVKSKVTDDVVYDDALCRSVPPSKGGPSAKSDDIYDDCSTVSSNSAPLQPKPRSILEGYLKRKSCKHLLASWRSCWAVLQRHSLLIYSSINDKKPKIISLANGFQVKQLYKPTMDTTSNKLGSFFLFIDQRPVYEFCAKNFEETEDWIRAFHSIQNFAKSTDENPEELYHVPEEVGLNRPRETQESSEEIYDDVGGQAPGAEDIYDDATGQAKVAEDIYDDATSQAKVAEDIYDDAAGRPSAAEDIYDDVGGQTRITEDIYDDPAPSRTENCHRGTEPAEPNHQTQIPPVLPARKMRTAEPRLVNDCNDEEEIYEDLAHDSQTVTPYSSIEDVSEPSKGSAFKDLIAEKLATLAKQPPKGLESGQTTSEQRSPEELSKPPTQPTNSISKENVKNQLGKTLLVPHLLEPSNNAKPKPNSENPKLKPKLKPNTTLNRTEPVHSSEPETTQRFRNRSANPSGSPVSKTELVAVTVQISFPKRVLKPIPSLEKQDRAPEPDEPTVNIKKLAKIWGDKAGNSTFKPMETEQRAKPVAEVETNKKSQGLKPVPPTRTNPKTSPEPETTLKNTETRNMVKPEPSKKPQLILNSVPTRTEKPSTAAEPETVQQPKSPDGEIFKTRMAFVAQNQFQISVNAGEMVQVLKKTGPCWLILNRKNAKGLIPKEYLVPL